MSKHAQGAVPKRQQRGTSLIEVLIAMLILGIVIAGIVPSFIAYLDINTRNEERTGAIQAAQMVMEGLRLIPPSTMPAAGTSEPESITVGQHTYAVVTRYCAVDQFCDTNSRHLAVEVRLQGELIYAAETVYTELR